MNYDDFLSKIIDDGTAAARASYADQAAKRRGSVAGFRACSGKTPAELGQLLRDARTSTSTARGEADEADDHDVYWEARCYEAEVEWVCNCVSAMLRNEGVPTIVEPTARGTMKAASVLGVAAALDSVP